MSDDNDDEFHAPGTLVIAIIFLITFIVVWYAHLKWVTGLWEIG